MTRSTQACFLRPVTPSDAPAHSAAVAASLPALMAETAWAHPGYGLAQSAAWTAGCARAWSLGLEYSFAACDNNSGAFLGICTLNRIDPVNAIGNLAFWTDSRAAGRGVATTAAEAVVRFGLTQLGLGRIEILTAADNAASCRVAEKIGARREGTLRGRLVLAGRRRAAALFAVLPEDLPSA